MIFGFLRQNLKTQAVAVAFSMAWTGAGVEPEPGDGRTRACERLRSLPPGVPCGFTPPGDALFALAAPLICAAGRGGGGAGAGASVVDRAAGRGRAGPR